MIAWVKRLFAPERYTYGDPPGPPGSAEELESWSARVAEHGIRMRETLLWHERLRGARMMWIQTMGPFLGIYIAHFFFSSVTTNTVFHLMLCLMILQSFAIKRLTL